MDRARTGTPNRHADARSRTGADVTVLEWPDATASLHGLTIASSTRANIALAAVEGMLCGLAAGLDAVRAVGVRAQHITLIGGAAQNLAVATIAAQDFDAPSLSRLQVSTSRMARPSKPPGP